VRAGVAGAGGAWSVTAEKATEFHRGHALAGLDDPIAGHLTLLMRAVPDREERCLHGCAGGADAAVAARMTRYCSPIRRPQGTDSACHLISANPPAILPTTINAALALLTDPCLRSRFHACS
jgi:hypothetical protein